MHLEKNGHNWIDKLTKRQLIYSLAIAMLLTIVLSNLIFHANEETPPYRPLASAGARLIQVHAKLMALDIPGTEVDVFDHDKKRIIDQAILIKVIAKTSESISSIEDQTYQNQQVLLEIPEVKVSALFQSMKKQLYILPASNKKTGHKINNSRSNPYEILY
jgi:hypothetical protein